MKRLSESQAELPKSRQKFPELEFSSESDPFDLFYSTHPASTQKGTFQVAPYPELLLQHLPKQVFGFTPSKRFAVPEPSPFLSLLSNYIDTLCIDPPNTLLTPNPILNHILTHIYKHKAKVQENTSDNLEIKDQAYTSAIVLILIPTLSGAKDIIDYLIKVHCKDNKKKMSKLSRNKYNEVFPEDFDQSADAVKFGIVLADRELNLVSPFKKADIILATPLSLRQGLDKGEKIDSGILASIQICAIFKCHEILMQNWEHVEELFANMNLIPDRDSVNVELGRIRDEYLDGRGKMFRQIVVQTEFVSPLIMALFNANENFRGKARVVVHYGCPVLSRIQKFRKFNVGSTGEISAKRFQYFTNIWSKLQEETLPNSLIFVSCYFEFVRLKSWLEDNDPGVLCISEYTSKPDRQRNLSLWRNGTNKLICITERLIYYRPLKFSNIGTSIFYELPEFKDHYIDIAGKSEESIAMFCKFDGFALQRIVGDAKAGKMLNSCSEIFSIN